MREVKYFILKVPVSVIFLFSFTLALLAIFLVDWIWVQTNRKDNQDFMSYRKNSGWSLKIWMKDNHVRKRREVDDILGFIEDGNYDIPELQALGYCVGSCIPPCRCTCHGFHDKADIPINWTCTSIDNISATTKNPVLGRIFSRPSKPTCRPRPTTRNVTLGTTANVTQGTTPIMSPTTTVPLPISHHFTDGDYDDSVIAVTPPVETGGASSIIPGIPLINGSTSPSRNDSVTLIGIVLTPAATVYTSSVADGLTFSSIGSDLSSTTTATKTTTTTITMTTNSSSSSADDSSNSTSTVEESSTTYTQVNTHYPCAIHCKSPCECTCYEDCECFCYDVVLPPHTPTPSDFKPSDFTVPAKFPHLTRPPYLTRPPSVIGLPEIPRPPTLDPPIIIQFPLIIQPSNPTKPPYPISWVGLLCCQKMEKVKRIFDRTAKVISDVVQSAVAFKMHTLDVSTRVKASLFGSFFKRDVKRVLRNIRNVEVDQFCINNQMNFDKAIGKLVNAVEKDPLKFRKKNANEELQKTLCV